MKVQVEWTAPMRFDGHAPGHATTVMEQHARDRAPAGPSPMEAVLMALCACSGIDVVEILEKMRARLAALQIDADAERAETPPRVFTKIHVRYRARGTGLTREQLQRAVDLSVGKYCSVSAMLQQVAKLSYEVIVDGESA